MPTPTGEKITSAHLRYLALKDVVQFPSDSYTLASASNVFFLKWSELGKWRILVDASAPYRCSATGTGVKTIYLNASECQISRYSTYIAPKLLAGKNGHLSYHTPSHWFPPSFFFFLSFFAPSVRCLLRTRFLLYWRRLKEVAQVGKKYFPSLFWSVQTLRVCFGHDNRRKDREAHWRLYLLDGTTFKGVSWAQSVEELGDSCCLEVSGCFWSLSPLLLSRCWVCLL